MVLAHSQQQAKGGGKRLPIRSYLNTNIVHRDAVDFERRISLSSLISERSDSHSSRAVAVYITFGSYTPT